MSNKIKLATTWMWNKLCNIKWFKISQALALANLCLKGKGTEKSRGTFEWMVTYFWNIKCYVHNQIFLNIFN